MRSSCSSGLLPSFHSIVIIRAMVEENLRETLLGGQSFSWTEDEDGSFWAVLDERVVRIRTLEDAASDPFLYDYFDLGYDYEKAREEIAAKDPVLHEAVESSGLIRLLHQDHFLTTISFILSQNNNINIALELEQIFYQLQFPDTMK